MFESIVAVLNFIFNTPLFYLIGLFVVIGYMAWRVRRDLQQMQGGRRFHVRSQSVSLPVKNLDGCERCGRQTTNLTQVQSVRGEMTLLCSSCMADLRRIRMQRGTRTVLQSSQRSRPY